MIDSKPLIILALGSVLGAALQIQIPVVTVAILGVFGLGCIYFEKLRIGQFILLLLFVSLSNVYAHNQLWKNQRMHFDHLTFDEPIEVNAIVTDVKGVTKNQLWIELITINGNISVSGKLALFKSKNCDCSINKGQQIVVEVNLSIPTGKDSPKSFDYKNFLANKGVHKVAFFDCGDIISISESRNKLAYVNHIQMVSFNQFEQVFENSKAKEELMGFMFGRTNSMDKVQLTIYRRMGIGHLFAVSGMHVMMVFGVFKLIIWLGSFHAKLRSILRVFSVVGIWAFVAICGFGPSAVRAALMLSFLILGRIFRRKIDGWNILAVTALIAVFYDPKVVFDIGFQFSYLALISIFTFYSKIEALIKPSNWLVNKIWSFSVLAICAQLGVLPLSLFYFGYFSPYFWLTGMLVFVQIALSMYLAIMLLFLSLFGIAFKLFVQMIEWSVLSVDYIIFYIQKLPFAMINWTPDVLLMFVLYIIVFWFALALYKSRMIYSYITFCVFLVVYGVHGFASYEGFSEVALIVPKSNSQETLYISNKYGKLLVENSVELEDVVGVEVVDEKIILHENYNIDLNPDSRFYTVGQWPKKSYFELFKHLPKDRIISSYKSYHKINLK